MKKYRNKVFRVLSAVFISVIMMCSLLACGSEENSSGAAVNDSTTKSGSEKVSGILIAYFSWSGNSKSETELIQEKTGGTLFEIVREEPYPEDYTECTEVAKKEKEDNERPSIKNSLESLDEYDKIIVCYPIWWHTAPMCVGTFLEKYDLQGKIIYPVSQSASMNEEQFEESLEFIKDCANGAEVKDGLFVDSDDKDAIIKYVEENILK